MTVHLFVFLVYLIGVSKSASLTGRVVGGVQAAQGEFPWMVSLQRNGFFGRSHFCAGSIVRPDTIVTAAHCIEGLLPISIWVVAGEHRLNVTTSSTQELGASRFIIHENYDPNGIKYDIAIIRLAGSFSFNSVVNSVRLPLPTFAAESGVMVTVAGWGLTQEGGNPSNYLMKATVPVVSDSDCRSIYGQQQIDDSMLCAGYVYGGFDACQGDSGGILMLQDGTLAGIVSWGYGCGRPNYPGVYTEVSPFVDWISMHMNPRSAAG